MNFSIMGHAFFITQQGMPYRWITKKLFTMSFRDIHNTYRYIAEKCSYKQTSWQKYENLTKHTHTHVNTYIVCRIPSVEPAALSSARGIVGHGREDVFNSKQS